MHQSPSRLSADHEYLVIDASVAINLLGTGRAADLLRVLQRGIVLTENALREVVRDPFTGGSGRESVLTLVRSGVISLARLSAAAFEHVFLELTAASHPDDLGDGEAATIAHAFDIGAVPVIEERKATRIALSKNPQSPILNTIDILSCPAAIAEFSRSEIGAMVFGALRNARMRVPQNCRKWVCDVVGREQIAMCASVGPGTCAERKPRFARSAGSDARSPRDYSA